MRMHVASRSFVFAFCAGILLTLSACGGGGGSSASPVVSSNCQPRIIKGFQAPISDEPLRIPATRPGSDDTGEEGQDGGDDGGDIGIGSGGALGKFVGAFVSVEFSNGVVLGPVQVDDNSGLVTIVPCGLPTPARITIAGSTGSTYFEEGTGKNVSFENRSLNGLMLNFENNAGVTALTEAIFQRVSALGNEDKASIDRYGFSPVPSSEAWKDSRRIEIASAELKKEINKYLRTSMEVDNFARLPTAVGSNSQTVFTGGANSVYGLLVAGLSYSARGYSGAGSTPSLDFLEQFVADFRDGRLNGRGFENGQSNSSRSKFIFNLSSFAEDIAFGIGRAASINGDEQTQSAFTQLLSIEGPFQKEVISNRPGFVQPDDIYFDSNAWRSDGAVYSRQIADFASGGQPWKRVPGLAPIRYFKRSRYSRFAIDESGTAYVWGLNGREQLGLNDNVDRSVPTKIPGLPPVSSIHVKHAIALSCIPLIARALNGEVYLWGGLDTRGSSSKFSCTMAMPDTKIPAPAKVAGITDAIDVRQSNETFFVLHASGEVSVWGIGPRSFYGDGSVHNVRGAPAHQIRPKKIPGLSNVVALETGYDGLSALLADGTVVVWGYAGKAISGATFNSPTVLSRPTQLSALPPDIFDIAAVALEGTSTFPKFVALSASGKAYGWSDRGTDVVSDLQSPPLVGVFTADQFVRGLTKDGRVWSFADRQYVNCLPQAQDTAFDGLDLAADLTTCPPPGPRPIAIGSLPDPIVSPAPTPADGSASIPLAASYAETRLDCSEGFTDPKSYGAFLFSYASNTITIKIPASGQTSQWINYRAPFNGLPDPVGTDDQSVNPQSATYFGDAMVSDTRLLVVFSVSNDGRLLGVSYARYFPLDLPNRREIADRLYVSCGSLSRLQ